MSVPYWRLSSFYLCYFAALGCYVPYWSLYLKDIGFNAAEIGQLSAFLVGTKIIAPNLWGWIADHTRKNLRIIRWTSFISIILFAGFLAVRGYFEIACLTVAFSFFWNAPLPLYEATTLSHLQAESHRYSRIRLWGSVGFIVSVMGVGRLLETQPIMLLPVMITGLLALNWLAAVVTPEHQVIYHEHETVKIASIIKKPEVIAFLAVYFLIQIAHAPYYVFYSLYLKQHMYSTTMTGLLWSLGVVAEIILFVSMKGILMRYSLRGILMGSLAFAVLRWLLIGAFVDNLWILLFAQLLHAATFGGTHIAAIHFVQHYFDREHQSKGQAIYHSVSFGLGGMLGSLGSGSYWELLGSHVIFTAAAICCGMAFIIAYIWVGKTDYCYN
jgi:MFS transporter, PPP family, 3-phenylpropionic acid transporter